MIKKIVLSLTLSSALLGDIVILDQIDPDKKVIQIASAKSLDELTMFSKRFHNLDQDIHIRNYKNKYHILYAVNIKSSALKDTLKTVRKQSPSAFVTKELSIYIKSITSKDNKIDKVVNNIKSANKKSHSQDIPSKSKVSVRIEKSTSSEAQMIKLQDTDNLYKNGISTYKQNNYQDAYKYFAQFAKKNPMDKQGNFFYGRSAFESSYYHEALAIYEKILLEDPNNLRVKLEIGQCYFRLKDYENAKKSFNEVLKQKLPATVKQNVITMLKTIDAQKKNHVTQAMLMIGYQYDSNVNNSPDVGDYTIYLPSTNSNINMSNDGEKVSDSSLQIVASLNHKYKLEEDSLIDTKATVFTQQYFHQHEKDLDLLSLESSLVKFGKQDKISIGLGYSYLLLESDSYMDIPYLKLGYDYKISPSLTYQGYLKILDKNYKQTNKDRDTDTYELYNSLTFSTKEYGINRFSLTLGKDDKVRGIRTDVNKRYYAFNIANNYSLSKTLLLKSALDYKITSYKDKDVNFLNKRKDKQTIASLGLMKTIDKSMTIGTNLQLIDNNSNQEPFDYDKYVLKLFGYYGF